MNILQLWKEWQQESHKRNPEVTETRGRVQIILILLLLISIFVGAMPGYLSGGQWQWSDLPKVPHLVAVKSGLNSGLELPNWTTIEHQKVRLGGKNWSIQTMNSQQSDLSHPIVLMLLPQNYYLDKPGVEWMDLNGLERWKTDSLGQLNFTLSENSHSIAVKARWFRAWNRQQTFAVVQWYAYPFGGSYSNFSWFWRDSIAQLYRSRVPWIAVSLKIPIKPLEDLDRVQPLAESLARQIQDHLFDRSLFAVNH
ncbi:MAG: cyanoexosortase B system-associated protein [Pleurocapsa sp.]